MAHGDAREGKRRGNWRMEWIASTLHTISEHGVSSITTSDAHTSAASSRLNWRPRRFKWTRPFRQKTKSGFCACAITFQLASIMSVPLHCEPRPVSRASWAIGLRSWTHRTMYKYAWSLCHHHCFYLPCNPVEDVHFSYKLHAVTFVVGARAASLHSSTKIKRLGILLLWAFDRKRFPKSLLTARLWLGYNSRSFSRVSGTHPFLRVLSPGQSGLGTRVTSQPPSRAEGTYEWRYTSAPSYCFVTCIWEFYLFICPTGNRSCLNSSKFCQILRSLDTSADPWKRRTCADHCWVLPMFWICLLSPLLRLKQDQY